MSLILSKFNNELHNSMVRVECYNEYNLIYLHFFSCKNIKNGCSKMFVSIPCIQIKSPSIMSNLEMKTRLLLAFVL